MTPPLDQYISPHAQQGIIAGVFIALGWWVVGYQNRARDAKSRAARVEDIQRALLAEIRAHVSAMDAQRMDESTIAAVLDDMRQRGHIPIIPVQANDRIYTAILAEVHLLPQRVIDPVVTYYRQISVMTSFAEAIQKQTEEDTGRAVAMFRDYLEISDAAREAGQQATRVLIASVLGGESALREIAEHDRAEAVQRISTTLPKELAGLRDRLSRRSSGRNDP